MGKINFRMEPKVHRYVGYRKSKGYDLVSNTSRCNIRGNMYFEDYRGFIQEKEFEFPSSEHFWWAHFLHTKEDIERFAIGGDLSTTESAMNILGEMDIEETYDVGVIAKIISKKNKAGKRVIADNLGLKMGDTHFKAYGMDKKVTIENIWKKILYNKFYQNPSHRRELLTTGNDILVEHSDSIDPNKDFWGGIVKGGMAVDELRITGGKLVGGNFMGKCLMETRRNLDLFARKPFVKMNPKMCNILIKRVDV